MSRAFRWGLRGGSTCSQCTGPRTACTCEVPRCAASQQSRCQCREGLRRGGADAAGSQAPLEGAQ
eukprot:5735213-Alexandrium_andersonii.AAC.1